MKNKKAFSLSLEQRVLWVRADGIWNDRTANDYVQEFRQLVQPIVAEPWAVVLDIRHWQLSPAGVFSVLNDNTRWCFEHNLRHVETIYADNAVVMWQFVKATDTAKPDDLVSQVAADEEAARKALQAAGFLTE
ncbi:hypothetical protein SAMN06297280_2586 [Arsukibacterium tuosuense]|uniref:STAS/SEC14 domain-containing protein n=1 Tax=Arsukibacterium tuosuense TaxID=1323745 RepID=A0A285J273_9GAMM|nr:hypothetical protein [Arsukibacterium tuosuense]SNY54163.1 hypothetical protein SAMN06297280_2586 [Arsukibacterium tuosuense]